MSEPTRLPSIPRVIITGLLAALRDLILVWGFVTFVFLLLSAWLYDPPPRHLECCCLLDDHTG